MAPHSSTLAWKIPWTEEPGGLQSMGLLRVGHDWATSLSFFTFMHWRRKWQPTPVFLPGESQGWEPGGLPSIGSHRVGHDWSDLAAAAWTFKSEFICITCNHNRNNYYSVKYGGADSEVIVYEIGKKHRRVIHVWQRRLEEWQCWKRLSCSNWHD